MHLVYIYKLEWVRPVVLRKYIYSRIVNPYWNRHKDLQNVSFRMLLTTEIENITCMQHAYATGIINGITHTHTQLHIVRIIMILLHGTLLLSFHFYS